MALDTGRVTNLQVKAAEGATPATSQSYAPSLQSGADIGQALKALREFRKLSLEAVADTTRVRRAYLQAIEEMQLDKLPSRPFTIGYIRAYAEALGADAEAAVERFKAEEPVLHELTDLGRPLVIGTSRKSFLGKITGRDVTERVHGTVATCVMAYERGASVFRVHDVAAVADALAVAAATLLRVPPVTPPPSSTPSAR